MKIFGYEPAALIAIVQALLVMLISFGWLDGLGLDTQDDVAVTVAVLTAVSAVILAFVTSATILAPILELFKAILAFGAIYGFHLTTEQTGAVIAFLTVGVGLFQRTQVAPLAQGTFKLRS